MNNIVFLNGKFLPADKALVSVFDRGFTYGDGIFETMRSYHGRIFALDLHWERLISSAKTMGISLRQNKSCLTNHLEKILALNHITTCDAYIRLTITRGVDYGRLIPIKSLKPTVVITAQPLDAKIKDYQKGIGATFLSAPRSIPHVKSLNLLPNIMGLMEAGKRKAQEGIFTDKNKILEGTVTNIFVSDGKRLKTPPIKDGILPGITRRVVLELAKKEGIETTEISLTREDLRNAQEAFLTNSIMEIAPLLKIENKAIGKCRAGILTKKLQQSYRYLTAADLLFRNK
ncbi:MAG: aminotransferase class IV [Deltaproteobacteria bacterium]|nr:aminotransferase class IV [Deltaproteobacteria bacterium]